MRLIKVAYISILNVCKPTPTLLEMYRNNKQYAFYVKDAAIRVGDIINNDAYNSPMLVMDIIYSLPIMSMIDDELKKQGIHIINLTLVLGYNDVVNGRRVYKGMNGITAKQEDDMEEERNIKVTLEQAIEWYNSGNATLRTLALSAYTEDELKFNFQYISNKVCNTCGCVTACATVPANDGEKYNTLADLAVIAKYFNGNWKKTTCNTGYFLGNYNTNNGPVVDCCNGVGVYQHNTVQYAGVVYFKNQEDAIKAVKILGKRVKSLFD